MTTEAKKQRGEPFPQSLEGRREVAARLNRLAPELMADIAALRKEFPGSRLTFFHQGDVTYGQREDGWQVDAALIKRVQVVVDKIEFAKREEAKRKLLLAKARDRAHLRRVK